MNNKISVLRKSKGLTQTELAKKIGISRQYLRDIEIGKSVPSVSIAKDFSDFFNKSIDDIFFENGVVHDLQKTSSSTS